MARYDRILISPSVALLFDAVVQGQRVANSVFVVLREDEAELQQAVTGMRGQPEGRVEWHRTRAGQRGWLGVAWWTDHIRRRHFRVVADTMSDSEGHAGPFGLHPDRPPIVSIYPQPCVHRASAAVSGWALVCGCGEIMPVGAPGWMGPHCAGCHDREQEGLPPTHRALLRSLGASAGSAVAADRIVVLRPLGGDRFQGGLCDLAGEMIRELPWLDTRRTLIPSADGRFVASKETETRLVVRELESGEIVTYRAVEAVTRPQQFAPDSSALAVRSNGGVDIWQWQDDGGWGPGRLYEGANCVAWTTDHRRLAIGRGTVEVLDHLGEPMPLTDGAGPDPDGVGHHYTPDQLFFSRNGDQLYALYSHLLANGPDPDERDTAIFSWRWADGQWVRQEPMALPRVEAVAVSPDARRLALVPRVSHNGGLNWREEMLRQPAVVSVFDVERRRSLGRIVRPPLGPLSVAEFLPDGKLLIEYHDGAIELLPWADLLGVPS